ncbi:MAG TPA: 2-amino-4-hydroxy-6-hydroxymethyldihydropteridine diphosphokinase [Nevskiaceae bacterium]|nr:2-amino-4-hydroxy-6-hydroxymethyldihydropteridine diphosphokinase [Nevskiaceae bacterium]
MILKMGHTLAENHRASLHMPLAYIGLGANLGDPPRQLRAALAGIGASDGVELVAQSPFYRSAPLGPAAQPDYCNAACAVRTSLPPLDLFARLLAIERAAGRVRDGARWGPRTLDLDLLVYEGVVMDTLQLRLPHPEIARRNFVLAPLADLAPDLHIDGQGEVRALLRAAGNDGLARWNDPL